MVVIEGDEVTGALPCAGCHSPNDKKSVYIGNSSELERAL
jgi:hypothetical protein